jgi:exopolysaccharide biosynthesis polyprenyl glycosylphosphotransferase
MGGRRIGIWRVSGSPGPALDAWFTTWEGSMSNATRQRETESTTAPPSLRVCTPDPGSDAGSGVREANGAARSPSRLKRCLMLADASAVAIGIVLAFQLQHAFKPVPRGIVSRELLLLSAVVPCFAIGAGVNRLYQARANERQAQEVWNVVKAVGVGIGGLVTMAFALQVGDLSRLWVGLLAGCMVSSLVIERQIARNVFAKLRATGKLSRRIVIAGTDPHALGLLQTYERRPELGYQVVGFVGDDSFDVDAIGGPCDLEVLGTIADLPRVLLEQHAVGVVVSLRSVTSEDVNTVTRELTEGGYHVALSSGLSDIDVTRLRPQQLDGRTMIYVEPVLRGGWRAAAKRAFDVTLASVLLVLSSPVLIAAMVAVRLDSTGPVLFHQTRVGRNGELFRLTKLRTMVVDAEERKAALTHLNESDGALFKIAADPRITRVGGLLRKLSIDELPQLVCVLRGTMSMVGPRPALPSEVAEWDEAVVDRLRVLPGLTGLWQVSGRSSSSFETYKRLDLYYVDNWSLRHDAEICARTVRVVMSGRGAA